MLGERPPVQTDTTAAAAKVEGVNGTTRYDHNSIEPHGAAAAWDGGRLIVRDASK